MKKDELAVPPFEGVLFLDRDGTINVDKGYIKHPDEVQLHEGAAEAILKAKSVGFKVAIITNQAGVAKGITPKEALSKIHKRIEELIAKKTGKTFRFDDIQVCPHHPDEKCKCRKPETQNLNASIRKLKANPMQSYFIGDKVSDLMCGHKVGIHSVLVLTGHGEETLAELEEMKSRDFTEQVKIAKDLANAVDMIIQKRPALKKILAMKVEALKKRPSGKASTGDSGKMVKKKISKKRK